MFFWWVIVTNVNSVSFLTHPPFLWMCNQCNKMCRPYLHHLLFVDEDLGVLVKKLTHKGYVGSCFFAFKE